MAVQESWSANSLLLRCGGVIGLVCTLSAGPLTAAEPVVKAATASEVLTRGPIHEAFAEVVINNPSPGLIVPKQPPASVNEQLPDLKPEGATVVWIPGYWAWDDDRKDFVWLTGVWRVPPPGSRWIPGYWNKTQAGYQWTAGFWVPFNTTQLQHLPVPPESKEVGPSSPAPSLDHFYSPGYWIWRAGKYDWQSGFWSKIQGGWTWMPPRYVWTPAGCVFVAGHWDYPLPNRGLLFAPVYFFNQGQAVGNPGVATTVPLQLTPNVVVNTAVITNNLFVRPAYSHYYFGDYYGEPYTGLGFQTWFAWQDSGRGYEPIFVYDRWHWGRNNPDWDAQMRAGYQQRLANMSARPVRTFADMNIEENADGRLIPLAVVLNQVTTQKASPLKLVPVTPEHRTQSQLMAQHLSMLATERAKLHASKTAVPQNDAEWQPVAWSIPRFPETLNGAFTVGQGSEPVVKFLPGVNNPNVLPGVPGRAALPGMGPGIIPNQLPGAGPGTLQGLGIPP
jgi:hypothetical protein